MPGLLQQDSHDRRGVEDHLDPGLSVAEDPLLLPPACPGQMEAINLRPDLLAKKSPNTSPALVPRRRHDQPQPPLVKGLPNRFGFGFSHPKGDLRRHLLGFRVLDAEWHVSTFLVELYIRDPGDGERPADPTPGPDPELFAEPIRRGWRDADLTKLAGATSSARLGERSKRQTEFKRAPRIRRVHRGARRQALTGGLRPPGSDRPERGHSARVAPVIPSLRGPARRRSSPAGRDTRARRGGTSRATARSGREYRRGRHR